MLKPMGRKDDLAPKYFLTSFTARCYSQRGVCLCKMSFCPSVCPSVCLSHACIMSKGLNISSKFFSRRAATSIQFLFKFLHRTLWQYSDGDPLTGESNAEVSKNCSFRPIYRFISEMIQDIAMQLQWSANGNSYAICRIVLFQRNIQ